MKKAVIITIIMLFFAVFASCRKNQPVTPPVTTEPAITVTAAAPEHTSPREPDVTYGDEWTFAGLDRQILAEDENWSVTGSGFAYKNGCLGVSGSGFFDLAELYNFGDEENYIFEFEYSAEEDAALYLGLNLLGINSLPTDPGSGIWLQLGRGAVSLYGADGNVGIAGDGFVKISVRVDQPDSRVTVSANGEKCASVRFETADGKTALTLYNGSGSALSSVTGDMLYSGGCVKLRSAAGCHVYIKNAAYKAD